MELPQGVSDKVRELIQNIRSMMLVQLAKNDRTFSEVVPGLYIGSIASLVFSKKLKETGITHVVSALKGVKSPHVLCIFGMFS